MASENNFDQSQLIEVFSKSPGPIRVFLSYENEDNDIAKAIHESLFELSFYTPKEYVQADLASAELPADTVLVEHGNFFRKPHTFFLKALNSGRRFNGLPDSRAAHARASSS